MNTELIAQPLGCRKRFLCRLSIDVQHASDAQNEIGALRQSTMRTPRCRRVALPSKMSRSVPSSCSRRCAKYGESRLTCGALGVHGVWVNGERIVDATGTRAASRLPGRLLRDFAA